MIDIQERIAYPSLLEINCYWDEIKQLKTVINLSQKCGSVRGKDRPFLGHLLSVGTSYYTSTSAAYTSMRNKVLKSLDDGWYLVSPL